MSTQNPRALAMNTAAGELRYRSGLKLIIGLLQDPDNMAAFVKAFGPRLQPREVWERWIGAIKEPVGTAAKSPAEISSAAVPAPVRSPLSPISPLVPTKTVDVPSAEPKVIAPWSMCLELGIADADQVSLDRIARCDLIFEGSRGFYADLLSRLPTGDVSVQARFVNVSAQKLAERINAAPVMAGDWRVMVIQWADLFDSAKCQFRPGDAAASRSFSGGVCKVRPLSFAIHDMRNNTVRKRALVEALT